MLQRLISTHSSSFVSSAFSMMECILDLVVCITYSCALAFQYTDALVIPLIPVA